MHLGKHYWLMVAFVRSGEIFEIWDWEKRAFKVIAIIILLVLSCYFAPLAEALLFLSS